MSASGHLLPCQRQQETTFSRETKKTKRFNAPLAVTICTKQKPHPGLRRIPAWLNQIGSTAHEPREAGQLTAQMSRDNVQGCLIEEACVCVSERERDSRPCQLRHGRAHLALQIYHVFVGRTDREHKERAEEGERQMLFSPCFPNRLKWAPRPYHETSSLSKSNETTKPPRGLSTS